jgi:hypothetical protein
MKTKADMAKEILRLRSENERLKSALKPFADEWSDKKDVNSSSFVKNEHLFFAKKVSDE